MCGARTTGAAPFALPLHEMRRDLHEMRQQGCRIWRVDMRCLGGGASEASPDLSNVRESADYSAALTASPATRDLSLGHLDRLTGALWP